MNFSSLFSALFSKLQSRTEIFSIMTIRFFELYRGTTSTIYVSLALQCCMCEYHYSTLQVSCLGEIGNRQLEMSLCKLVAFVLIALTELHS